MSKLRTIQRWAAEQLGKPADLITTSDILTRLPRRQHLRYDKDATTSPLGGRIAPHLRHLEEEEAQTLLDEGEAFLRDTPEEDDFRDTPEEDEDSSTSTPRPVPAR